MHYGLTDKQVFSIQKFLNDNGFSCGNPDGMYGEKTFSAVRQYQKLKGLEADGIAGKNTISSMQKEGLLFDTVEQSTPTTNNPDEYDEYDIPSEISKRAFDLIVEFEVGGKQCYDRHPEWPEGQSGVTIGIGYDIGMSKRDKFLRDWAGLPTDVLNRLSACAGVSGYRAKLLCDKLKDISIPYEMAMIVFSQVTLQEEIAKTKKTFEGAIDKLSPDAFGALVSLIYNRGTSLAGSRRTEMLEIRKCCLAYSGPTLVEKIAQQLEAMIPLWEGQSIYNGMRRRRLAEAGLVRLGGAKK